MADMSFCPGGEELKQFARGTLEAASAERIIHHLSECRDCVAVLENVPIEDTLIEALQTCNDAQGGGEHGEITRLIQRLKGLKLESSPGSETTAEIYAAKLGSLTFLSPPQAADELGRLGNYRIVELLGAGGMGRVYQAEDVRLKRKVALKVMKPELAANAELRQRFLREAESCAAVRSDHVVTIYQVGEHGEAPFLAMEFLEGLSLADWLSKGHKPSPARAARVGRQIALGLADAHACGLIHRDIKPANIWLDSRHDGRVKLLDFGLARGDKEDVQLTQSGAIVGTPAFMAPEQARGEKVDSRADLFSLGVVMYQLTTGQMPFRGDNPMSLLASLALDKPKPPRQINADIPPRMAALIESLLAKDREKRPATAKAVAEELAIIEREATQPASDERTVQPAHGWLTPAVRRWAVAASLLLLGGVAAAIVVVIRDNRGHKIAEVNLPEGGIVELKDDGNGKPEMSRSRPLPPLLPGEPVATTALVRQPAKLPGVRSWTIETRASTAKGEKENSSPFSFRLSPGGQTLATLLGRQVVLSSLDTGQVVAVLKEATGDLAWSPDGKTIATGGTTADSRVLLWDSTGRLQNRLTDPTILCPAASLAWAPDGKRLASAFQSNKEVIVWDAEKGTRLPKLGSFSEVPDKLSWSPARILAFWVHNSGWHFWNVEKNRLVNDPKQWTWPLLHVTPDGCSALVRLRDDMAYRLRDLATAKILAGPIMTGAWVDPPMAWSPSGELIARVRDANIELWRVSGNRHVRTLRSTQVVEEVAFTADGKRVAGRAGERLHVWETDTGRLRGMLLLGEKNNGLTITADGYYTGNEQVERGIVMVVLKDDGTQEVLEPADFEQKYGWKNEPDRVHLLQPLPPPPYPLPGMPMGPNALVREPNELPDAHSWTIETVNTRGVVKAVAYRPDGKLLASGGDDGTIRLWDTSSGKLIRMLIGDPVESLSWSKDGKLLATVAFAQDVSLWEADTGRLLRRLMKGGRFVAWSPGGETLAILHDGALLQLWDKATERVVHEHRSAGRSQGLAWSPDGKTIAVGLDDKTLRLWDVASRKEMNKLDGQKSEWIRGIAWSPDSKRLVSTADGEPNFCVWDAATGKLQARFPIDADNAPSAAVAWLPAGNGVVIGRLGLFDPDNGRCTRFFDNDAHVTAIAVSPDGKQLARAGSAGSHLLETATGKRTHTLTQPSADCVFSHYDKLAWSPDGRRLALGLTPLRIVEAATGQRCAAPQEAFQLAAWSPDGRTLAAKGTDNSLQLWDALTLRPLRTLDFDGHANSLPLLMMEWSPDGKMLAAGGQDHFYVWSVETGMPLFYKNVGSFGALAWSADGGRLAFSQWGGECLSPEGSVWVWQRDNDKLLMQAPLPAFRLAWAPDGKKLAVSTAWKGEGWSRGTVALIDAASGKLLGKGPGIGLDAALRWFSDGKKFAALHWPCPGAASMCVWDGGRCDLLRKTLLAGLPETESAAWSPDGRVLASAGDSQVHLHDAAGQPLGVLLPFDAFGQLAVTPDGHYRGNARAERLIRMVVQKRDGTTEMLSPHEFEQKYGWKNEPAKVRLIDQSSH